MINSRKGSDIGVVRYVRNVAESTRTAVVEEAWLEIRCNGRHVATLACSPFDIESLVVGQLYFRGFIEDAAQVRIAAVFQEASQIRVEVEISAESLNPPRELTGSVPWSQLESDILVSPWASGLPSTVRILPPTIPILMRELYANAREYQVSRGIHAAGISEGERFLVVAEDLSRHCAMDKAIGQALVQGLIRSSQVLCTTGRLSSGLICRAHRAGIEVLLSRTSPTGLAVSLGARLGLTLVGYIRGDSFTVYTGANRVTA